MFQGRLVPLESGAFLALTLDARSPHEAPPRSIDLAYAFVSTPDGANTDCFALVTEPLPADPKLAKKHADEEKANAKAAEQFKGKYRELALANAARSSVLAGQALVDARRLPVAAWALGDGRVLLEYQEHRRPRWYRIVALGAHEEIARFDADAVCKAVEKKPFTGPAVPSTAYAVLAARGDRLLINAGLARAVVRRIGDRFERVGLVGTEHGGWHTGAATARGFVCPIAPRMDDYEIVHFDVSGAHDVTRWPRQRRNVTHLAGTSPPSSRRWTRPPAQSTRCRRFSASARATHRTRACRRAGATSAHAYCSASAGASSTRRRTPASRSTRLRWTRSRTRPVSRCSLACRTWH